MCFGKNKQCLHLCMWNDTMMQMRGDRMIIFSELQIDELVDEKGFSCACGRHHQTGVRKIVTGENALTALPEALQEFGYKQPFIISDVHTHAAAGGDVCRLLDAAGIPYKRFTFMQQDEEVEPDERAMGALVMAFDPSCDVVLAVGSGVLNDCAKVLAHGVGCPCAVVATAPSMDGYASDNASMVVNHVKESLYVACPTLIVADTRVLAAAPERLLRAGLGDMMAKYVSLCEWRISQIVTGEYYCENIAGLMRSSLAKIRQHAQGLLRREKEAVQCVLEGLVVSGIAMSFARISRPASGLEHYFSHLWEMKALEGKLPVSLHGIQVGVGTCLTAGLYDKIRILQPSYEKAMKAMEQFSIEQWEQDMLALFGPTIQPQVISLEARIGKNDPKKHAVRLRRLLEGWPEIQRIIAKELPRKEEIVGLMNDLNMATTPQDIGISRQDTVNAFLGSREIRDKYLTSSMLWDLGELQNFVRYL